MAVRSGSTLHRPRIRTLRPVEQTGHRARLFVLLATLPLFAGSFHYTRDILPFYIASKAWPFLLLPAALIGYLALRLPARTLYAVTLAYLVSVPPLMAMFYLGSSLDEAMLITVKYLPISYFFSLSLMLAWLRPSAAELRSAVTNLGIVTFAMMAILWVVVPQGMYRSEFGIDTVFIADDAVRGDRIQMPMFFGLLLVFKLGRDFAARFRIMDLAKLLVCYVLLAMIYKERIPIAFSGLIVLLAVTTRLMRGRLNAVLLLACLGAVAGTLGMIVLGADTVIDKLGGSLSIRIDTAIKAWAYISDEPLRWLFGVGSTTKYAATTINDMFRDPAFFLADIGWLGVVFEAGVVGAVPIAALMVAGLVISQANSQPEDSVSLAFSDYGIYLLAASIIYSPTLLPGEIACVTALAVYLRTAVAGTSIARQG